MTSLFDLSVNNFIRVLNACIVVMNKAQAHFQENPQGLEDIVAMRLAQDMLPFTFQVNSVRHHTLHAVQGLITGETGPGSEMPALDFAGLINVLVEARAELEKCTPQEINALASKTVTFRIGSTELPFTAENFVQSFSLPNLHFHATTLYDMLRIKGVPLSKMDYLGQMAMSALK